jgi:hypothetical protein
LGEKEGDGGLFHQTHPTAIQKKRLRKRLPKARISSSKYR